MPVRAPQAGVRPVRDRAALKKLSFTTRCRSRSRSYSSAAADTSSRESPRAVRPSTVSSVTAVWNFFPAVRRTLAWLGSSPS